jgi:hypothetical protein
MSNNDFIGIQQDTEAWKAYTKLAVGIALTFSIVGLWFLPLGWWLKGYILMSYFFSLGSVITMTKTMRDEHESKKVVKRLNELRAEKIIKDYELAA